jgi:UDP-N-acetylglucosamine--N-acetylmuramyl-(pentapeptide) pyrophosphoryl-undecaprenol N-acetylglucosamine transferase
MITIAFTGGGTGGHIYPGLAVASELKKLFGNIRLIWIGSSSGMDRSLVEEAGIDFFGIPSGKLRRYFSLRTAVDVFKVIAGFFTARKILKKEKAFILFSKGGFVSVPPCAAAASLGIPVFTHESDYSPGLATKINVRFVMRTKGRIFTAYKDTERFFPETVRERITVSGNPVRGGFRCADAAKGRAFLGVGESARILLVLGGSQGAREINELVRAALPELTESYTVVHQTGPNQEWDIAASEKYKPYPYIKEEMINVIAAAEIVMGRSGAGIWEWAVSGKPMILIPLRGSGTRGDQVENARYFEKAGAAVVLNDVNPEALVNTVKTFAQNTEKRKSMADASLKAGEGDGAKIIANILAESVKSHFKE